MEPFKKWYVERWMKDSDFCVFPDGNRISDIFVPTARENRATERRRLQEYMLLEGPDYSGPRPIRSRLLHGPPRNDEGHSIGTPQTQACKSKLEQSGGSSEASSVGRLQPQATGSRDQPTAARQERPGIHFCKVFIVNERPGHRYVYTQDWCRYFDVVQRAEQANGAVNWDGIIEELQNECANIPGLRLVEREPELVNRDPLGPSTSTNIAVRRRTYSDYEDESDCESSNSITNPHKLWKADIPVFGSYEESEESDDSLSIFSDDDTGLYLSSPESDV